MGKIPLLITALISSSPPLPVLSQSGNVGTDQGTGEPVIFDPSSFFGHNEAEYGFSPFFLHFHFFPFKFTKAKIEF